MFDVEDALLLRHENQLPGKSRNSFTRKIKKCTRQEVKTLLWKQLYDSRLFSAKTKYTMFLETIVWIHNIISLIWIRRKNSFSRDNAMESFGLLLACSWFIICWHLVDYLHKGIIAFRSHHKQDNLLIKLQIDYVNKVNILNVQ